LNGISSVVLQPRDLELFRGLYECRILLQRHITAFYFQGHHASAKKRVQRLKSRGYLHEQRRFPSNPSIYSLTPKSFAALKQSGLLSSFRPIRCNALEKRLQISDATLAHEIQVLDARMIISTAFHSNSTRTSLFQTWPVLYQFNVAYNGEKALVKPDGYFRVIRAVEGEIQEQAFFLEVDRSTESLGILARKAVCYAVYYKSGGYVKWRGKLPQQLKEHPFRVLFVVASEERRDNTARCLLQLQPPIRGQIWLTTWAELKANPLGDIWLRPMDYQQSFSATHYEISAPQRYGQHRRQVTGNEVVEGPLLKLPLLEA